MAERIRLGIIGASGTMGKIRLEAFSGDPRCRVVAACARDRERLETVVGDLPVRMTADPEAVHASPDIDAVAICINNTAHHDHCKRALQAGKHVLCEYPLTNSLDQYDELCELARSRGLVLHHSLTVRGESLHRTLKTALESLGEPRCAYYRYYGTSSWYVKPELRGDIFCALHIHFMDQFADLFGDPQGLVAHGVERDGKQSGVVMMQWDSGLVGTIEFCMGFTDKPDYMGTIVTTDGWCGFSSDPELAVTVARSGGVQRLSVPPDTSKQEDGASFLDEILGSGEPQRSLDDGRRALAMCLECSRQAGA